MFNKLIITGITFIILQASVFATCGFNNDIPIKSFTSAFPAWKAVAEAMKECGNVQAELDNEFRTKQPQAFAANPSLYHIGGVANSTLVPLLEEQTIRPLDSLVAQYGKHLKPANLIKENGKVMAVAMMVNNQHFMYRKDIFDQLNIAEPKTYNDVLTAAKKIQRAKVVDYPLGGTYKTGWNLGEEFINLYLAYGGDFFKRNNTGSVNNTAGRKTLALMKKLTAYMDPEYLTGDSTFVQKQFQQGKIAMANLWASRAGAINDPAESSVVGKVTMSVAPAVERGGKPASTLWWDGIVIAQNISDQEAEVAFRVALEGIDRDMVVENNDEAVWLIDGYVPTDLSRGAIQTAEGGAPPYPASAAISLMHTALGNNISDYLTGKKNSRATLAAVEKEYNTAAREKGLVR